MKTVFLKTLAMSLLCAFPSLSWANQVISFRGDAKVDGKLVYVERHTTEYDEQGHILTAVTHYLDPSGKPLADLNTDFRENLAVPAHTFHNFRTGNEQGLRHDGDQIVIFDHDQGKDERIKVFTSKDADGRIFVAGQGLNFYVLEHLAELNDDKTLPLRLLIPGKLDAYDFALRRVHSSDPQVAEFEIKVENWFLKIFAPTLHVRYDVKSKRILWYQGLSNLKNDKGDNQSVTITYAYD